jgi:hypothetical protein
VSLQYAETQRVIENPDERERNDRAEIEKVRHLPTENACGLGHRNVLSLELSVSVDLSLTLDLS